jgi:O-antigen ligase
MKYLFKDKSVSIDYFLKCFILLGSLISIVVFIEYVLHLYPLSIDVKLAKKQSIDAGFGNSNNVAYFLFMCFCSGMYLLIYAKKKIFSILAIVFIVLAIYICASRTIYLSIVIIGFLYFIFLFDRNIISKLFYVIIFLLSVIIFYNLALSLFGHDLNSTLSNTNNYLLHKQHDVLDSNLGARKDIYINYLKIFFESFFMGVGPGFAYYYFPLGSVFDPHSIILGVMAESGLPGIILIAVFFYNRFIQVKKSNAADKFILLMLFVVIFIAGNTPSKAYFMFPLWFFIISINELLLINKDKA